MCTMYIESGTINVTYSIYVVSLYGSWHFIICSSKHLFSPKSGDGNCKYFKITVT